MKKGHKYGTHRVISPKGVLPQPADKLDNNMDEIYDNEILIDVQTLNIDSASFTQISNQAGGDKAKIAEIMLDIVEKQGKHRNPVTGSGGMLLGTVEKIGDALVGKTDLKVGDKIATLVSLSLTPHYGGQSTRFGRPRCRHGRRVPDPARACRRARCRSIGFACDGRCRYSRTRATGRTDR